MSYVKWLESHARKHQRVVQKLQAQNFSKEQIVDYFDFDTLCIKEPDYCPLFKTKTKCHETVALNCFFCGCPHFRFYENPTTQLQSFCAIDAEDGAQIRYKNMIHQDCSLCKIPHQKEYILQNYTHDWAKAMKMCKIET
ncbi:MAG: hypothetical protein ACQESH_04130 [Campylobacterota bacterium]